KDVPFFPLEDGHVRIFTDADLVVVDDDFQASRTAGAERVLFHTVSPPPASMCGQPAPWSPLVSGHALRMRRTSVRSAFRSASLAPTGAGRERAVPPPVPVANDPFDLGQRQSQPDAGVSTRPGRRRKSLRLRSERLAS